MIWVTDSFLWNLHGVKPGIYGNHRNVHQKCPNRGLAVEVLKTRIAQLAKTRVVTEMLTKRIFAPKNRH